METTMRIGIICRAKQGDILEALQQREWSQKQGAEFLGMDQSTFDKLINMNWVPEEFSPELTIKLYELTGKTPEHLFPEFARQRDFLAIPKVSTRILEITPAMLASAGAMFLPLPPDEITSRHELERAIDNVLKTLTPREEKIVRRCIMEEETLEEVGQHFSVTGSRIAAIRNRALRKLRHPKRSRILRGFIEV